MTEQQTEYYYLKEGEIIQDGDEVDICNDGWRDDPKWQKTTCIGKRAPDPSFPSHRRYRRKIFNQSHKTLNAVMNR